MRFFRRNLQRQDPETTCKNFRRFQLLMQLFNDSQAAIIFVIKNFCLSAAILFTFIGIYNFHENFIAAMYYLSQGAYGLFSFVIIYDKAFEIPIEIVELKAEMMICAVTIKRVGWLLERTTIRVHSIREYKAVARSFRVMSIKAGEFKCLDGMSTPEFVSFVFEKTASLLVAAINWVIRSLNSSVWGNYSSALRV